MKQSGTDRPDLQRPRATRDQLPVRAERRECVRSPLTSRITQRGSGQPRPPASRRTGPQQAGSAVTFPRPGRLTGSGPLDDLGPTSPAVRELVPGFGACPGCRPRDIDAPGRPGRDLRRSSPAPRPAISSTARGGQSCMHDGRSTGATAINEDPVGPACAGVLSTGVRCINIQARRLLLSRPPVGQAAGIAKAL